MNFRDAKPAPTEIPVIAEALLAGCIWTSWIDAGVADPMRAMFGPPHAEDQQGR